MIDLHTWRSKLGELRSRHITANVADRNDLIDGLRSLLRSLCGGLFTVDGLVWHPRKLVAEERIIWLRESTKVIDAVRVLVTLYLTNGEVGSWSDNGHPETYFLVAETLFNLSPAEQANLLRQAFVCRPRPEGIPEKYRPLIARMALAHQGENR